MSLNQRIIDKKAATLDDWIEENNLKQLEEDISTAIEELQYDVGTCTRAIMIFIRQAFDQK